MPWEPSYIIRPIESKCSGSEVVLVKTDCCQGYGKFLGNKASPHVLACEFLGTRMAMHLGLPTFEHGIVNYDGIAEIELESGRKAEEGPAWVTRREIGDEWSGDITDLSEISNREDVAKLVVLDTWLLNCDRFFKGRGPAYRNVFFARRSEKKPYFTLLAMDHTHCFTCGSEITKHLGHIDSIQSDEIYGLFPAFRDFMLWTELDSACKSLSLITDNVIRSEIDTLPSEWEIDKDLRQTLFNFITRRRDYVAEGLVSRIFSNLD